MKFLIFIAIVLVTVDSFMSFADGKRHSSLEFKPTPYHPKPSPTFPERPSSSGLMLARHRRQSPPQNTHGGVNVQVQKMEGRKPSVDVNYNHRLHENPRGNIDAYGGAHYESRKVQPQAGLQFERQYKNGFLGGYGQVQPRERGRGVDPSFGLRAGFRF